MAPLICCGFRRTSSPDLPPIKLVEHPQSNGRLAKPIGSFTATSPSSSRDPKPIHAIFASASDLVGPHGSFAASGHDPSGGHTTSALLHRKESSKKLHDVALKVRKRISRDSEISRRGSKRSHRNSLSEEDTARRQELKRARHQRLQTELLQGPTDSEDGYDEDAVPIKTPGSTLGKHQGSVRISPGHLSRALDRSATRSISPKINSQNHSQRYAPDNTTRALSRILTQRASNQTNRSGGCSPDEIAVTDHSLVVKRSKSKYVFTDDTPRKLQNRSPSPGEVSTIIKGPTVASRLEEQTSGHFGSLATSSPQGNLTERLYSASDAVAGPEWRPYSPRSRQASTRTKTISPFRGEATGSALWDSQSEDIAPVRAAWLRGASGLMADSPLEPRTSARLSQYEMDTDDQHFGGVDGQGPCTDTMRQSDDSNPVHLYNMRISQNLVTRSLVPSSSSSQLRGKSTGDYSFKSGVEYFDMDPHPHRHKSSSGNNSANALCNWDSSAKNASSSDYSTRSRLESLAASRQSSIVRLNNLADRLHQLKQHQPTEHIISVPAARLKPIDLDKWEAGTIGTASHPSSESLRDPKIAEHDTRIQPTLRAKSPPKNSGCDEQFSQEDIDEITAELARTHPRRRSYNGVDGSDDLNLAILRGEFLAPPNAANSQREQDLRRSSSSNRRNLLAPQRNHDKGEQTSPSIQRQSFLIPPGDQARGGSVWDIALREHAEEDAKIRKRRPGSISFELDQPNRAQSKRSSRQSSSLRHERNSLSCEIQPGTSLQAQLKAFKLPTKSQSPRPLPSLSPSRTPSPRPEGTWSHFPSHTREERSSSPASDADNVLVRDFAKDHSAQDVAPDDVGPLSQKRPLPIHSSKRARSMSFRTQFIEPLTRLYRSVSLEFRSKSAFDSYGHRSSISGGISAQYPELEMLPSISPPVIEESETSEMLMEALGHTPRSSPRLDHSATSESSVGTEPNLNLKPEETVTTNEEQLRKGEGNANANMWSKVYEDCLVFPNSMSIEPKSSALTPSIHVIEVVEDLGPMNMPNKEAEIRASTVDFGEKLEQEEKREREKVLRLSRSESYLIR